MGGWCRLADENVWVWDLDLDFDFEWGCWGCWVTDGFYLSQFLERAFVSNPSSSTWGGAKNQVMKISHRDARERVNRACILFLWEEGEATRIGIRPVVSLEMKTFESFCFWAFLASFLPQGPQMPR